MKRILRLTSILIAVILVAALSVVLLLRQDGANQPIVAPADRENVVPLFDSLGHTHFLAAEPQLIDLSYAPDEDPLGDQRISRQAVLALDASWARQEHWGSWALGERSTLRLLLPEPRERQLMLDCWSVRRPKGAPAQVVSVELNGTPCGSFEIGKRFRKRYLPLPVSAQLAGINQLALSSTFSATPQSLGMGDDPRPLAVGYRRIGLHPGDQPPGSLDGLAGLLPPLTREGRLQRRGITYDAARRRVIVARSGALVAPVRVPERAEALEVAASLVAAESPARWRIAVERLDGSRRLLLEQDLASGAELQPSTVPIAELAGETCLFLFEIELSGPGSRLELAAPLLELAAPSAAGAARQTVAAGSTAAAVGTSPGAPDIVLIILDAARPDHFGCYGYSRSTTPAIDGLASESLLYRNAFALAPYTICSVPTMLTGLSFIEHGVRQRGHRLADDATTLAEHLQAAGYRTIAYTATPNNGTATAVDQGYNEYSEVWRDVDERDAIDPHRLAAMVRERLALDDGSQPLHLQLHIVPPHEPYQPDERYDLFSDPAYSGSADGSHDTLEAINSGARIPDQADLEHIVALYDGNLLRSDSAVAIVLDALRARSRWSNTVVLITADHGEALYEHGWIGHNATANDEMLRVPFILRLPTSPAAATTSDRERPELVTLADIVPTLLGLAGIDPGPGLAGIDLLAAGGRAQPDRYLVARTSEEPPAYALRTTRWKVTGDRFGNGVLFDLASDPDERHNLVLDRSQTFRGLTKLMQLRLRGAVRPQSSTVELDDEERAMLRTLGYLE